MRREGTNQGLTVVLKSKERYMPGVSHTIIQKDGFELSIDANNYDDGDPTSFDISLGTGFSGGIHPYSVNVELNHLTLFELETIAIRINEVIEEYKTKEANEANRAFLE